MIDTEITAIAREYAEEMIKGKPSEELPNCLKNSMLSMNTEYIAEVFQWLTRRYCLVEKEGLKKKYAELKSEWRMAKGADVYTALIKMEFFESLFPEIAKEVER